MSKFRQIKSLKIFPSKEDPVSNHYDWNDPDFPVFNFPFNGSITLDTIPRYCDSLPIPNRTYAIPNTSLVVIVDYAYFLIVDTINAQVVSKYPYKHLFTESVISYISENFFLKVTRTNKKNLNNPKYVFSVLPLNFGQQDYNYFLKRAIVNYFPYSLVHVDHIVNFNTRLNTIPDEVEEEGSDDSQKSLGFVYRVHALLKDESVLIELDTSLTNDKLPFFGRENVVETGMDYMEYEDVIGYFFSGYCTGNNRNYQIKADTIPDKVTFLKAE